jgi:hypothetical protein
VPNEDLLTVDLLTADELRDLVVCKRADAVLTGDLVTPWPRVLVPVLQEYVTNATQHL